MPKKMARCLALLIPVMLFASGEHDHAVAQQAGPGQGKPRPLNPDNARLNYFFPVRPGEKPFRFKVNLDKTLTVTGVSVFRDGESSPFQTLSACDSDLKDQLTEYDESSEFLRHADLNFDGFEDLKLLIYYIPHLDKRVECIYMWDDRTDRFRYSPEISQLADPIADPKNKTITAAESWQGGAWESSTYRWAAAKLELIEQEGLYGDWSNQAGKECGFSFTCRRLINGEMVTTLEKPVCTPEEMDKLPDCPIEAAPLTRGKPTTKTALPKAN